MKNFKLRRFQANEMFHKGWIYQNIFVRHTTYNFEGGGGVALGPIRNCKTVEKIIQNRKTEKKNSIKTGNRM